MLRAIGFLSEDIASLKSGFDEFIKREEEESD